MNTVCTSKDFHISAHTFALAHFCTLVGGHFDIPFEEHSYIAALERCDIAAWAHSGTFAVGHFCRTAWGHCDTPDGVHSGISDVERFGISVLAHFCTPALGHFCIAAWERSW